MTTNLRARTVRLVAAVILAAAGVAVVGGYLGSSTPSGYSQQAEGAPTTPEPTPTATTNDDNTPWG